MSSRLKVDNLKSSVWKHLGFCTNRDILDKLLIAWGPNMLPIDGDL